MREIFILEDQLCGLNLIKEVIFNIFGEENNVHHESTLASVSDQQLRDCVIGFFDLSLPDGMSFDLIKHCKSINPNASVIVTTLYSDDDMVFKALKSGADGYLLKSDGVDNLTRCCKRILDGEPPMSPQIARKLMSQFSDSNAGSTLEGSTHTDIAKLTNRESQVLSLIAKGMSSREIGEQVHLSTHTVNGHVKDIYKKLKVHSRSEATAIALKSGVLDL